MYVIQAKYTRTMLELVFGLSLVGKYIHIKELPDPFNLFNLFIYIQIMPLDNKQSY